MLCINPNIVIREGEAVMLPSNQLGNTVVKNTRSEKAFENGSQSESGAMSKLLKVGFIATTLAATNLFSIHAHALNIGEAQVQSYIGQTLKVFVPLSGSSSGFNLNQLQVSDASSIQRSQLGINRGSLSRLTFNYQLMGSGPNRGVLITTTQRINEPYVNLAFQVSDAVETRVKELPILLDLPSTNRISQPKTSSNNLYVQSEPINQPAYVSQSLPVVSDNYFSSDVSSTGVSTSAANTTVNTTTVSTSPEPGYIPNYGGDIMGPYDWAQEGNIPAKFGPVIDGQSLWRVARRINKSMGVSVDQMMWALYRSNPQSFSTKSVNSLQSGSVLNIPEEAFVKEVTERQAIENLANGASSTGASSTSTGVSSDNIQTPADSATNEFASNSNDSSNSEEQQAGGLVISSLDKQLLDTLNATVSDLQEQLVSKDMEIDFLKGQIQEISGVSLDYDLNDIDSENIASEGAVESVSANLESAGESSEQVDLSGNPTKGVIPAELTMNTEVSNELQETSLQDQKDQIDLVNTATDSAVAETSDTLLDIDKPQIDTQSVETNDPVNGFWKWLLGGLAILAGLFYLLRGLIGRTFRSLFQSDDEIVLNIPSVTDTGSTSVTGKQTISASSKVGVPESYEMTGTPKEIPIEDDDFYMDDGDVHIEEINLSDRIKEFLEDGNFASARKTVDFADEADMDSNFLDFCRLKIFAAEKDKPEFAKVFNRVNRKIDDFQPDIQHRR